jgi:hypothetical protein
VGAWRDLRRGSRHQFCTGRRHGRGGLGVRARGPCRRAVEGVERDWQAGSVEQRHRRVSVQRARAPTRRPHWAERERAGPHGSESGEGERRARASRPNWPKGRNGGQLGFFCFLIYFQISNSFYFL